MLVLLERPDEYCVLRMLGDVLDLDQREAYGGRRLRHESKPCGSAEAARSALDAAVARRVKARWAEAHRVDDPRIEAGLARLHARAERWAALAALDLDKGYAAATQSRPAGARQLANVTACRPDAQAELPSAYRNFLRYTMRLSVRCVFTRGEYRSEVNSDIYGGYDLMQRGLREHSPSMLGPGDLCIQDDLTPMERLRHAADDGAFSGAVLHPDGSITSFCEGRAARTHVDFYAYFDAWITQVDQRVEDSWADDSRRA